VAKIRDYKRFFCVEGAVQGHEAQVSFIVRRVTHIVIPSTTRCMVRYNCIVGHANKGGVCQLRNW
jgi:hypothetical protein